MLSVIVPVFNKKKYLNRCLQSVVGQSYSDLEIILVDDGSKDGSAALCDSWCITDSRIRVIHQDNLGAIKARDVGISMAQGEFITFVDSDDWIEYDYFARLMDGFIDSSVDISVGSQVIDYERIRLKRISDTEKHVCVRCNNTESLKIILQNRTYYWTMWGKIYKIELVKKFESWWFRESWGEDAEFSWKVFNKANNIMFLPVKGYHYCINTSSISHANLRRNHFFVCDRWKKLLGESYKIDRDIYHDMLIHASNQISIMLLKAAIYNTLTEKEYQYYRDLFLMWWKDLVDDVKCKFKHRYELLRTPIDNIKSYYNTKRDFLGSEIDRLKRCVKTIYIYGAGNIGDYTARYLEENSVPYAGFVVSATDMMDYNENRNIFSLDEFVNEGSDDYCFVVAVNKNNEMQIKKKLVNNNISDFICVGSCFCDY